MTDPLCDGAGVDCVVEWVDERRLDGRRRNQSRTGDGTARELGSPRLKMEVDWLGGEYRLQKAVVLGELGEERNIGVVANGEDISLRWMRRLLPESGVPGGDVAADDGLAAIGAAVGEESDGCVGLGGLGECGREAFEQVGAAAKMLERRVEPLPDRLQGGGDGLRPEGGCSDSEEKDVEAVDGLRVCSVASSAA